MLQFRPPGNSGSSSNAQVESISEYLTGQKSFSGVKAEVKIENNAWLLDNATVSTVVDDIRISAVSGYYSAIYKDIKKLKFKVGANAGYTPFVLIGIGSTYTAVGVHTGVQRRVFEITKAGASGAYTQVLGTDTALTGAAAGDEVIVELSGTWVIASVKRVGGTEFSELFRINMSLYPAAVGWNTLPRLGFVKVSATSGVNSSIYQLNDSALTQVGENITKAIENLHARTIAIENDTPDFSEVNVRLDGHDQEIDGLQSQINTLNPATNQGRWFGKTWNALGDSFTQRNLYPPVVKNLLGIGVVNNYGSSGDTITFKAGVDESPMSVRFSSMSNTADLITVWGGVNDYGNGAFGSQGGVPIGTNGDTANTTFKGALKVLIEGLITKYPTQKIAFITPCQMNEANASLTYKNGKKANATGHLLIEYVDAMKEICALYGIPCLDMYRTLGLNELNMTSWTLDGLHLNEMASTYAGQKLGEWLKGI